MISRSVRYERCCCAATWLCVGSFMLILFGFDYATGDAVSPARRPLIIAAGVAFVLMVISVAIAIRMEAGTPESGAATRQQSRQRLRHTAAQPSVPRPGR